MTERDRTAARVLTDGAYHTIHYGIDYSDGYRVTVGWSEEDDSWIAEVTDPSVTTIGTGETQIDALCCLVCALAATVDALNPPGGAKPEKANG